ncbi:hypothetical protein COCCU_11450 [Corynebacterium occultum]|uniref:Antitoxin n=1 Tax=Corynebacterium occultum TaxID=2675219 RepID=A0A6B8VRK3_9CORY|nr:antitoxin [Corynebacterium occultum]QGU08192.1 hypothetical protein COCCU_11450 [Corynebacterium occultum]
MGIFDKAKEALKNEQLTDNALDKVEDLARRKLGADKADQIKRVRDQVDERVGEGNPQPNQTQQPNQAQRGDNPEEYPETGR